MGEHGNKIKLTFVCTPKEGSAPRERTTDLIINGDTKTYNDKNRSKPVTALGPKAGDTWQTFFLFLVLALEKLKHGRALNAEDVKNLRGWASLTEDSRKTRFRELCSSSTLLERDEPGSYRFHDGVELAVLPADELDAIHAWARSPAQVPQPRPSPNEGRVGLTPSDCESLMTRFVTASGTDQVLYISVGECDFHKRWIPDLYDGTSRRLNGRPRISRIVIKCIAPAVIENYEQRGWLEPRFGENLASNLKSIQARRALKDVPIDIRYWQDLPPFHGFLFGDDLLMGHWEFNGEYFHHRTLLYRYTRQANPIEYDTYLYSMNLDEPSPLSPSRGVP